MRTRKNVLISHIGIPSGKIGSWNVMFERLINNNNLLFNYIISPKPSREIKNMKYFIVEEPVFAAYKIEKLIKYYKKKPYWKALKKILLKNQKEIITLNIIDNIGILLAINFFSKKEGLRDRLHINYFLHGYNFDRHIEKDKIYNSIDTLILLTNLSYKNQLINNHAIPCEVKLLRNGVDSTIFYPIKNKEKQELRSELNLKKGKIYFLWISQDRPKKGLKIVLKAWRELIINNSNIELIIIGTYNEIKEKQVVWLERMVNYKLAKYYQATDYYLFSTLCHEGHPLSLTEALKCGAKCLASDIDPIPEVLQDGKLGMLIEYPNFVSSWIDSINYVLNNDVNFNKENIDLLKLYDFKEWSKNIKKILDEKK